MEICTDTLSEKDFKIYVQKNIKLPILDGYISETYITDIYNSFLRSIQQIKSALLITPDKPSCIVIDLDETFLQNDDFYPFTLKIWKYND